MAKKGKKPMTAAAKVKTEPVYVAHAMLPDKAIASDARRVLSSFEQLRRAGQLDEAEVLAAETYRDAYDTVCASMGGAMDFDRARAGGTAGGPVSPVVLLAAERLNQARGLLYDRDFAILSRVVGEGASLTDCIHMVPATSSPGEARREAGRRLRQALDVLADKWVKPRGGKIRADHADDAISRTRPDDAGGFERGKVAHAVRHRVRHSNE